MNLCQDDRMNIRTLSLWVGLAAALHAPAHAARPFITDDARLTTAGSCQLESWRRASTGRVEFWALPACNPTGHLELTLGGAQHHLSDPAAPHEQDAVVQGKTVWGDLARDGWAWGLAVGVQRHGSNSPQLRSQTDYAYLPLSVALREDRLVLHTNLGMARSSATRQTGGTWGAGTEWWLAPRWMLMTEAFGSQTLRPQVQAGFRFVILPDLLQVDLTRGSASRGPGWWSLGLRYTPASLF